MGVRVPIQVTAAAQDTLAKGVLVLPRGLLRTGVRRALRAAGVREAEISLTLLGDAGIAELNAEYLGHDRPTDVIAFALHEPGEAPLGDVYLGVDEALRQARSHGVALAEELLRLAVHGTLHVLGHDHPAGTARLRSPMWRLQEEIVSQVAP
jgi:probable rRNA maturation factor